MQEKITKPGFYLSLIATLMAAAVVGLGAFTRLVDAGLGCPDWPTCYGHIWAPQTETDIALANAAYPEIPVDHSKTWPEMVHRYLASSLGLLIIALNLIAYRYRKDRNQPTRLPLFLFGFVVLQGAFGAWTVTLKLWPQVVTAHLLGGFTTLTLLAILTYRLSGYSLRILIAPIPTRLRVLAAGAFLIVIVQVFLGGWTTSNYAALTCPDLPTCQTQWWPDMNFARAYDFAHPIGPNYLGGKLDIEARTAIHMSHRIGALVVTIAIVVLALSLFQSGLKGWSALMLLLLCLQITLGVGNVTFGLPLAIAVAHNLVGALLMMSTALLNVRLYQKKEVAYG